MKFRKKMAYLDILCKNFHFDTNLKEIHAFKVVKYLTTHFSRFRIFPLLARGVARRDVILYKVDCILHCNERNCCNFDTCFVINV